MTIHSKNKGKRGELELVSALVGQGFKAQRGVQYKGSPDSPDVVVDDLPWLHAESKRCEKLSIYEAMDQAEAEAGDARVFGSSVVPVVFHRRNNRPWLAILRFDDLCRLLREVGPEGPGERIP